ncbi:hypothetical protein MZE22_23920, partial [Escherichia coli]|uniref:hypothetical protein n=1 Tax=Escherichia coli TaxID=562 RepID=UPI001FFE8761|nr:hypothetical protein [Escherichia coli]MCK2526851.1 hypothetical protein [Escherichia coli]
RLIEWMRIADRTSMPIRDRIERNTQLVFWFVRVDDEGYPEIARCTEREFATILAGISAGGMYCPECGTVHWPDGVTPPV